MINLLAFESTAKPASVALLCDGVLVSQYTQISGLTHSRTLLPMGEKLRGEKDYRFIAVEPASCPSFTRGKFAYDFCDTGKVCPLAKMYTLGSGFMPYRLPRTASTASRIISALRQRCFLVFFLLCGLEERTAAGASSCRRRLSGAGRLSSISGAGAAVSAFF